MRLSNIGGCQPNHATNTGELCFDLTSANATVFCLLLTTIDQISIGFLSGNDFAYASTIPSVLSPKRSRSFVFTPARSMPSRVASVRLGDCSLVVEQIIMGTPAADDAGSG